MWDEWLKSRKTNLASPLGRAVSTASVIGLHMVVAVFIGFGIGYFLDGLLGTAPWLTGIFLLVGIAAGFKNLFVQGKRLLACQEKMDAERRTVETTANNGCQESVQADQSEKSGYASDLPPRRSGNGCGENT